MYENFSEVGLVVIYKVLVVVAVLFCAAVCLNANLLPVSAAVCCRSDCIAPG